MSWTESWDLSESVKFENQIMNEMKPFGSPVAMHDKMIYAKVAVFLGFVFSDQDKSHSRVYQPQGLFINFK